MSEETKTLPTNEAWNARFLREGGTVLVRRLRALADAIEHENERNMAAAEAGTSSYGQVVSAIDNKLAWGIANLSVGNLVHSATQADIAHAKGD